MKLYDAPRCPYCARVRIALAVKGLAPELEEIDLRNRPPWLYELNPVGKVPVLDDGFILPESAVIMEYLDERYAQPSLLPADPSARARARLHVFRFDELLGDDYYAFRRGEENELAARLDALPVGSDLFTDVAFAPWVIRARHLLGVELPARLGSWLDALAERQAIADELELVRSFA